MGEELRKNIRFQDFGRIECESLCALPGRLNDISLTGFKATFSTPVSLNMDDEYEISIRFSKKPNEVITLLVSPVWKFESSQNQNDSTQIGFSILRAKDFQKFSEYVNEMEESEKENLERKVFLNNTFEDNQSDESQCQFL